MKEKLIFTLQFIELLLTGILIYRVWSLEQSFTKDPLIIAGLITLILLAALNKYLKHSLKKTKESETLQ
ncbi:hypothetical protein SDC9_150272 [bioreactor metagenome]|uniref:Uncharacterized protein n=1 Tax=bioreactor metagenome TaxID=1076179 RepID=A0A645EPG9_9ZZZZ